MVVEQNCHGAVLRGLGDLQGRPIAQLATNQHCLAAHVSRTRVIRCVAIAHVDQHSPQPCAAGLVAARKGHAVTLPADRTGRVQRNRRERLAIDVQLRHRVAIRAHREGFDACREAELAEASCDDLGERGFFRAAGHHRAFAHTLCDAIATCRNEPHVGQRASGVEHSEHALLVGGDGGRRGRGMAQDRECRGEQRGREGGSSGGETGDQRTLDAQ